MTAGAWRHGWRIVRARPVTFAVYLAHYLVFYTLPLATGLILRAVFDDLSGHASAGLGVWSLVAMIAAAEVARLAVIFSTVRFGTAFHLGLESLLRGAMLGWMVSGPGSPAATRSPGEIVSRFRDDVDAMNDFMEAWIDLSGELLLSLAALAVMVSINALITSVVVLPLIAVIAVTDRLTGRIQRLRLASREAAATAAGFIGEAFGAVSTIRLAGAEDRFVARLDSLNETQRRSAIRDRLLGSVLDGLRGNLASVGAGLVLLLAAGAMRRGEFTVGDFALFSSYVALAGGGPRWIGFLLARRRQADVSIYRMDEVMAGAPPLALTAQPFEARARDAKPLSVLSVSDLSYQYPGGARGIAGVDLQPAPRRLHRCHRRGRFGKDHAAPLPAGSAAGRRRRDPLERRAGRRSRRLHGPAQVRLHAPGAAPVQRVAARQHPHGVRSQRCSPRCGDRTRRSRPRYRAP